MAKTKKNQTPMEKLTAGYENFIKGKETNPNGAVMFSNVLGKAVAKKVKQRGSK
jgi:hypothetical protein